VGVIFATSYFHHEHRVEGPRAAQLNSATAQPTAPIRNGLVIRKVTPARTTDGLVVDGEIANLADAPRQVPQLRLALQDSAEKEVGSKTVDPPKAKLEPGEVEHFEAPFVKPPDTATGVVVTFASSGWTRSGDRQ
jgi:hypothetical protein